MKINILKYAAIALLMAISFSSCSKKNGETGGEETDDETPDKSFCICEEKGESEITLSVQYQKCECDREIPFYGTIEEKNIWLFDAEKITYSEILSCFRENNKEVTYVFCDFTLKVATFRGKPHPGWFTVSYICNFPYDSLLEIPKKGVCISFTAEQFTSEHFETCQIWDPIPETFCFDIILTSLKIQTQ